MFFSKKKRQRRKAARRYKKEVKAYNTYISLNKKKIYTLKDYLNIIIHKEKILQIKYLVLAFFLTHYH